MEQFFIEKIIAGGDLGGLSPQELTRHYMEVCDSLRLNWRTEPFKYLRLNNKLILYATKSCTDQLRAIHGVSITDMQVSESEGIVYVHVKAHSSDGRLDEDMGFSAIGGLKGEALGNARLRAVTKAKRRVTLSICGLGMLDETEVADMTTADAHIVHEPPPILSIVPHNAPSLPQDERSHDARGPALDIDKLVSLALQTTSNDGFARDVRRIMELPSDFRVTKKWLKANMPRETYDQLWAKYILDLKHFIESDTPDFHADPPSTPDIDEPADEGYATAEEMIDLRKMATSLGLTQRLAEALVGLKTEGVPLSLYRKILSDFNEYR